jgi:HAD superfamily hydrolase (TIGR01509 family)
VTLMGDKERRKSAICDALLPLPGVVDRMDEARRLGLGIAVASSSSRRWVETHLARLGLRAKVDAVLTKDDVARVKPFPDLYLAAAAALGVAPAACVTFEDSANGVKAAKAAGMTCYAVPNPITKDLVFDAADGVLGSLADITLAALHAMMD